MIGHQDMLARDRSTATPFERRSRISQDLNDEVPSKGEVGALHDVAEENGKSWMRSLFASVGKSYINSRAARRLRISAATKAPLPADTAKAILLLGVLSACGSGDSPPDTAAAVFAAPVSMPILIFEAGRSDRETFLERARGFQPPLPPLEPETRKMADSALRLALAQSETDMGLCRKGNRNRNGCRAASVTALSTERVATGAACRDVLVETVAIGLATVRHASTRRRRSAGRWKEIPAQP